MDFFDNVVTKAKEAIDVASKKTGEVVSAQKQKIDVITLENKRAKDFEALGEIYYNMIKSGLTQDSAVEAVVAEIDSKNEKIANLKKEINTAKNKRICPKCGAAIETNSNYCNVCGEKLFYDSEDDSENENTEN